MNGISQLFSSSGCSSDFGQQSPRCVHLVLFLFFFQDLWMSHCVHRISISNHRFLQCMLLCCCLLGSGPGPMWRLLLRTLRPCGYNFRSLDSVLLLLGSYKLINITFREPFEIVCWYLNRGNPIVEYNSACPVDSRSHVIKALRMSLYRTLGAHID